MRKLFVVAVLILFLTGCSAAKGPGESGGDLFQKDWAEIEGLAKGSKVRMFMWGGDTGINRYMDEWVAPRLKDKFDINFERTPMDINEVLQKLTTEKKAGAGAGTIDIIWLNGENFKNAKANGLLAGPFSSKLPNYQQYVDGQGPEVNFDFGTPVEGMEAPWGKVQFVFLYDSAKIAQPPRNFEELARLAKENPGKFTYPEPGDFTGNAFLRHLLYEAAGVENLLKNGFDKELAESKSESMWAYLREIKPYLWRQGETYPQSLAHLDQLYSRGEVWFSMGYNEARAEHLIRQGDMPATTKTFVMEPGSIGNVHFVAIPFNSSNKAGAMAVINFLLSPDAQLAKMDPAMWGESAVLDINKLSTEDQGKAGYIARGASVLDPGELKEAFLPEVDSGYVEWIKEKWLKEVVQPASD